MSAGEYIPVRKTPTNSGPDSKGMVSMFGMELEGTAAFYIVGGAVGAVLLLFALPSQSLLLRFCVAGIPFLGSLLWVKLFIFKKPAGFQSNTFERLVKGNDFRLEPRKWCKIRHPRSLMLDGRIKKDLQNG